MDDTESGGLSKDPLYAAVYSNNGMKRAVEVLFEQECFGSALILIFAAIDAMANLVRPEDQVQNTSTDFKTWVGRYLKVADDRITTPEDWWAARNAVTHTYGPFSRDSLSGRAKTIAWMSRCLPHVRYAPQVDPDIVMVDVFALRDAFCEGLNRFIIEAHADEKTRRLIEGRRSDLLMLIPFKKD